MYDECKLLQYANFLVANTACSFHYRFLRGIAYREFTRLVHGHLGGRRIPLLACSYHAIKKTFPEESTYAGFETEDAD